MPKPSRNFRLLSLSLLNGVLMLVLSLYWLGLPYTFDDEAFLIKWTALTKKSLLGIDEKPLPESVLFVDVSGSKTTLPQKNVFGETSRYHREVITDREDLAGFLALARNYQPRAILLDVLMDLPSPKDSILQAEVDRQQSNLIAVNRIDTGGQMPEMSIHFDHTAIATYRSAQGLFLKYPLIMGDSLPTVPTLLYERTHGSILDASGWFYRYPNGISLRNPIVDFKVRTPDFRAGTGLEESNFYVWALGDLLESQEFMDSTDLADLFDNRLILVGDFENDIHNTPFGESPGILLIYNAYLTLVGQNNIVSFWWLLLLLASFTFISWRIFNDIEFTPPKWLSGLFKSKLAQWLLEAIDEVVLLITLTVLSYFLFNVHINILILLVYCKIVDLGWNRLRPRLLPSGPKLPETDKPAESK